MQCWTSYELWWLHGEMESYFTTKIVQLIVVRLAWTMLSLPNKMKINLIFGLSITIWVSFTVFSTVSCSFNLLSSSSCSINFPKSAAIDILDKSQDSEIAITLDCQLLSRQFSTFMLNSSLSKTLPRPVRWFTICVNRFCTSAMLSSGCILNNSYSWMSECFLERFTSSVPSWVTSSTFHISLAELHWDTLKNSSIFNAEVMMFLARELYWAFFLSLSLQSDQGFFTVSSLTTYIGIKGPLTTAFQIPMT